MKFLGRKCVRTCLSMLLIVTCLLASFSFWNIKANAETIKIGTVTAGSMHLRAGAGKDHAHVTYLYKGDSGTILDQGNAPDGKLWYKMSIKGYVGWASAGYIDVTEQSVQSDETFEAYLTAQGFPESYKSQLRILHDKYPHWVFEAQQTKLNWDDVIKAESAVGVNTVENTRPASWKSMQTGAYDWEKEDWIEIDSGGWVAASAEIIAYCMDPRNFLDETNIFQFIKQSYKASALNASQLAQKKADLTSMVKNTYLDGNCEGKSYVDLIMEVAAGTGVCPLNLASMMLHEQGRDGSGGGISGTNDKFPGYYNYFSIGAYKTSTLTAVQRGLWYAKGFDSNETSYYRPWNTRTAAVWGGASYYGKNYVNEGQDTLYLKKFNVQGSDIYKHQYMTNVQGAIGEGKKVASAYDANARATTLIFKIPVYDNMPESACTKPTGNSTSSSGGSAGGSSTGGSSSGTTTSVTSSSYQVNGNKTVTGIVDFAKINVLNFLNKISVTNGNKMVTNSTGAEKASNSKIGTGDQLVVGTQKYTIIVYGDTNGDGGITALDLLRVQKHILDITKLKDVYGSAADTSKDGKVNALDLLQLQKHILNIKAISQ